MVSLPIPASLSNKLKGYVGLALVVIGVVSSVAQGFNAVGLVSTLGGITLAVDGFEEFITGNVVQGAQDIQTGVKETATAAPSVPSEVKAVAKEVEANPAQAVATVVPIVEEAKPKVEAAVEEAKSSS
jgi:uncharacterized sodium:solute symporter family permease YidK